MHNQHTQAPMPRRPAMDPTALRPAGVEPAPVAIAPLLPCSGEMRRLSLAGAAQLPIDFIKIDKRWG